MSQETTSYFLSIMKDPNEPTSRRDWAAAQAAPYVHPRLQSIDQRTALSSTAPLSALLHEVDGTTRGIPSQHYAINLSGRPKDH